jgi:hypothetical protein
VGYRLGLEEMKEMVWWFCLVHNKPFLAIKDGCPRCKKDEPPSPEWLAKIQGLFDAYVERILGELADDETALIETDQIEKIKKAAKEEDQ